MRSEIGYGIDESPQPQVAGNPVEVAVEREAQMRHHVERAQAGCVPDIFHREGVANLADKLHPAVHSRNLSGDGRGGCRF
jgi:hypothetical protein